MIIDEINKANITAIKNKDMVARSVYSVAKNKIMLETINKREKGETLSEGDVQRIIAKLIKELDEEKQNYIKAGNEAMANDIQRQAELMSVYLPKMLSKEEIKTIIMRLDNKNIGAVMGYFKANYNGSVDMRQVQEVLKEIL